jgi:hypothetical protein
LKTLFAQRSPRPMFGGAIFLILGFVTLALASRLG